MSNDTSEFLREIQGIILLIFHQHGVNISVRELLEKDQVTYDNLVEMLNNTQSSILKIHIRDGRNIPNEIMREYRAAVVKKYIGLLTDEEHKEILRFDEEQLVLPSEFQNYNSYKLIKSLSDDLIPSIEKCGYHLKEIPIIASTQTFQFNAMAIGAHRGSKPLILFDDEAFTCCHLISKIFTNSLGEGEDNIRVDYDGLTRHLNQHPEIDIKFRELIQASYKRESFHTIQAFPFITKELLRYYNVVTNSMEYFLLGHEFGHIIKGHLENKNFMNASSTGHFELIPSWEKEYEADYVGLRLALTTLQNGNSPPQFHLIGIDILYTYLQIIDEYSALLKDQDELFYSFKRTHPPPSVRRDKLRQHFMDIRQDEDGLKAAKIASEILFELWLSLIHI